MVRSINVYQNLLMVITVQRVVTVGAGVKTLLGSANTVCCYGLVRLGMVRFSKVWLGMFRLDYVM